MNMKCDVYKSQVRTLLHCVAKETRYIKIGSYFKEERVVSSRQTLETRISLRGGFRKVVRYILPEILLVLFLFTGCGSVSMASRRVDITIELDSNPTTGYIWSWSQDGTGSLSLVDESFIEPSTPMLGAGGKQVFVFSGGAPGEVTLTFIYARPWESPELAPADMRTFHYIVDSHGNIMEPR